MSDLDHLLEAAKTAGPADRIELRDPIAAHGAAAIPSVRAWLPDPRLGPFAVRTLEKIAGVESNRKAVLDAIASVDRATLPEAVARDISESMARLGRRTPPPTGGARHPPRPPAEPWPGPRQASALELRFHHDMLDIFRLAGEATRRQRSDGTTARGYWASYFLRGVRNHGGPSTHASCYGNRARRRGFSD